MPVKENPTLAADVFRIADRLGQVPAGSLAADKAVYEALGRAGPMLPYTREKAAARSLLPAGFEWMDPTIPSVPSMPPAGAAGWMGSYSIRIMDPGPRRCRWRCAGR